MQTAIMRKTLEGVADKGVAPLSGQFFKTGPGQHGEVDVLLGTRVHRLRSTAKSIGHIDLKTTALTVRTSPIYEERLLALLILIPMHNRGTPREQQAIYVCSTSKTPPSSITRSWWIPRPTTSRAYTS